MSVEGVLKHRRTKLKRSRTEVLPTTLSVLACLSHIDHDMSKEAVIEKESSHNKAEEPAKGRQGVKERRKRTDGRTKGASAL